MSDLKNYMYVFPGQGAQYAGMLTALEAQASSLSIHGIVSRADAYLGYSLSDLCRTGCDDDLRPTQVAQLAIFVMSCAWLESAAAKTGGMPVCVAGHSLGELTAYYAAGVYSFETGLAIIQARSQYMAEAYPADDAAMIAVIAKTDAAIQACLETEPDVVIANYNAPTQWVLSGKKAAVARVHHALAPQVNRVIPLRVSGPFHSPLMQPAVARFEAFLRDYDFKPAQLPVILNRTAAPEQDPERLKANLALQLASPVRWVQSIQAVQARGIQTVYEVGPGRVLTGLIRKIAPEIQVNACP